MTAISNARQQEAHTEPNKRALPRVVFIGGLTHSGSTLVDLILGSQAGIVGLGEVMPLLRSGSFKLHEADRMCSCARYISECPFWSRVIRRLDENATGSIRSKYSLVLNVFAEVFGPKVMVVDSSKSLGSLQVVSEVRGLELKVIHLVRDVRSWCVSRGNVARGQKDRESRPVSLKARVSDSMNRVAFGRFLVWYHGNRRMQEFLQDAQIEHLIVSYERMAIETERVFGEIAEFLELREVNLDLASSGSHICLGNKVRLDLVRRAQVQYDYKWLRDKEWQLPALLLPHVMRYNTKTVHNIPPAGMILPGRQSDLNRSGHAADLSSG